MSLACGAEHAPQALISRMLESFRGYHDHPKDGDLLIGGVFAIKRLMS